MLFSNFYLESFYIWLTSNKTVLLLIYLVYIFITQKQFSYTGLFKLYDTLLQLVNIPSADMELYKVTNTLSLHSAPENDFKMKIKIKEIFLSNSRWK